MSPVLNCVPSSPPSDQETYQKGGSVSDASSQEIGPPEKESNGDLIECRNEDSCCEDARVEDSRRSSPTNNNSIPLNYKKSPSPSEGFIFEPPIRPWNSSPSFKNAERGQSVSPSSSGHRPSPCPPSRNSVSPDVSSENSRIPSHASSEAHDAIASPDSFRSLKMSTTDMPSDISFPFHDNRLSSDSFRLSNSFIGDPLNPYLRLPSNPLNPFQPTPGFLGNPFLGAGDPKLLLNNPSLGLITQQLHHLNGLSTNVNKMHPPDLQRMSMEQLQFLQNQLQSLPALLHPSPYSKFTDPKNQLSMLIQARKQSKTDPEALRKDVFTPLNPKTEDGNKMKQERRSKQLEFAKNRKTSMEEGMEVDNYEDNNSDSDELLSVGSVSPPPNSQVTLSRGDAVSQNDAGLSTLDSSSSIFPNRTNDTKKYSNVNGGRVQNSIANTKPASVTNRTLKFSIDNILKSDFGNEEGGVKKPKQIDNKKESERTPAGKKKPEGEKETPVDLSQDNANAAPGTDTPMLWPAWVYCTRYSDRPSSGPRTRRSKNKDKNPEEKRPRTAFSGDQLSRLKHEFAENRYLTERRRQDLARELGLNEAQIKIWFQNKRAKMKKARGEKNPLALQLMAQGLYNHSTVPLTKEEEEAAAADLSD